MIEEIYFPLYCFFRWLYLTVRAIIWLCTGYQKKGNNYETSANVEKIFVRQQSNIFDSFIRCHYFTGFHLRFEHPKYVLSDNVILMCVNKKEAVFLEMPKSVWHYSAEKSAFCWITLYEEAVNTITIPLKYFNMLADSLGDIRTPAVLISNEGRCGSTLLCTLLSYSNPRVLVLSELDPFQNLHDMIKYRKNIGKEEFARLVRSVAVLTFKHVTDADAIVIKLRLSSMEIVKHIANNCPEIKHVYNRRRHSLKTLQSWERCFRGTTYFQILLIFARYRLFRYIKNYAYSLTKRGCTVYDLAFDYLDLNNSAEVIVVPWATNVFEYEYSRKYAKFEIVYYEDIVAKPEETIKMFFELFGGVKPTRLDVALKKGLIEDSQKNTPISQDALKSLQPFKYELEAKRRINAYLDALHLAHLD